MTKPRTIKLTPELNGLIGIGRRSRLIECGFEAVRRALLKQQLTLILIDREVSRHTLKAVDSLVRKHNAMMLTVLPDDRGRALFQQTGYKVMGFHYGGLQRGFIEKLKQESQWQ